MDWDALMAIPSRYIHHTFQCCSYYLGIPFLMNFSALKPCAVIKGIEWLKKWYLPNLESYSNPHLIVFRNDWVSRTSSPTPQSERRVLSNKMTRHPIRWVLILWYRWCHILGLSKICLGYDIIHTEGPDQKWYAILCRNLGVLPSCQIGQDS